MVFGTPASNYDEENASRLLRSVGEARVAAASARLLEQGVLSKVVRDKKRDKPGRRLQISDAYVVKVVGRFKPVMTEDPFQESECSLRSALSGYFRRRIPMREIIQGHRASMEPLAAVVVGWRFSSFGGDGF